MKISLEMHGQKTTIEISTDYIDLHELMQILRKLLLSSGYQPDSIDQYVEAG